MGGRFDMEITPDSILLFRLGPIPVNATIFFTWVVMAALLVFSWLVTRNLTDSAPVSRGQNLLEIVVCAIQGQIREVTGRDPNRHLPFVGTLFLFIAVSNALAIVPGFRPPTGSLSTTSALALCVFLSVIYFGVSSRGLAGHLRSYIQPSIFMLPFNLLGEVSRTVALAIRLFGNMMSGSMVSATILAVAPFFFPVFMNALGLLIGLIQAYIFFILATVFIASAVGSNREASDSSKEDPKGEVP